MPGTEGATDTVFFSPDGQWVAFTRVDEQTPAEERAKKEKTDVHVFYPGDTRERTLESSMFISISAADLATKPDGVIITCLSAVDGFCHGEGLPYNGRLRGRGRTSSWNAAVVSCATRSHETEPA